MIKLITCLTLEACTTKRNAFLLLHTLIEIQKTGLKFVF